MKMTRSRRQLIDRILNLLPAKDRARWDRMAGQDEELLFCCFIKHFETIGTLDWPLLEKQFKLATLLHAAWNWPKAARARRDRRGT